MAALSIPGPAAALYALQTPWYVIVILVAATAVIGIAAKRWAGREACVGRLAHDLDRAGCDARTKHDVLLAAVKRPPADE